jgi:hypothetical protein
MTNGRTAKLLGRNWLGGLDSNQDNQIQNLMYCQLYDLPVVAKNSQLNLGFAARSNRW